MEHPGLWRPHPSDNNASQLKLREQEHEAWLYHILSQAQSPANADHPYGTVRGRLRRARYIKSCAGRRVLRRVLKAEL